MTVHKVQLLRLAVETNFTVRKDFNQDSAKYSYRENIHT